MQDVSARLRNAFGGHEQTAGTSLAPIGSSFEAYGCRVNELDVDDLFEKYEQAGFLYPAKMKKLAPFLPLVKDNWRKARRAGELIQWVGTYENSATGEWSSISSWLSTQSGWLTQHLVSIGGPLGSRAVMLAGAAVQLAGGAEGSHQNWFRRENRYANRIFGSSGTALGKSGWIGDYSYHYLPPRLDATPTDQLIVSEACYADFHELRGFLTSARSEVFVEAEGLADDDLCLDAVDQLYRRVGLKRYRRVLIARERCSGRILGTALAYRGPLGLNFSFLENRCDLVVEPTADLLQAQSICHALCASAGSLYSDFEPNLLPVVIDLRHSVALRRLGAEHLRDYAQSIWLNKGLEAWYRHTERFYDALVRTGKRRGLGTRNAAPRLG